MRLLNVRFTTAMIALVVAAYGLRLEAGPPANGRIGESAPGKGPKEMDRGEALSYSGRVTDKETGKPIEGATVVVRRSTHVEVKIKTGFEEIPGAQEDRVLGETEHRTDAEGRFRFTIPPEQVAERDLGIQLSAWHPDYATQGIVEGQPLDFIRANEKNGDPQSFENIGLRPGRVIEGRVVTPEGRPAEGVKVEGETGMGHTPPQVWEPGSSIHTKTDDQGRFRFLAITPGVAVIQLIPDRFPASTHVVEDDSRGDLGTFTLREGIALKGRALDEQGKPLAGIFVNADRLDVPDPPGSHMGLGITRSAVTDQDGRFRLSLLSSGAYRIIPENWSSDPLLGEDETRSRPLPAVFAPVKVVLKRGEAPEDVEIRAVPRVKIAVQHLDGKGRKRGGHNYQCGLFGRIKGLEWGKGGFADAEGKVIIEAPRGLEDARLELHGDSDGAIRRRLSKGAPLSNDDRVKLGTLDRDVEGIEVVCYESPVVVVKVMNRDGKRPKGIRVSANYRAFDFEPAFNLGDPKSEVTFEEYPSDHGFRSQGLFPDEEVTITASADGYEPRSATVSLPEGATRDLVLVLDKRRATP